MKTQDKITKEELARLVTLNNVKGKIFRASDVSDDVLDEFNKNLKSFSQKHPEFDLFGTDYSGEEVDEFLEMLYSAIKKDNKLSLFESVKVNIYKIDDIHILPKRLLESFTNKYELSLGKIGNKNSIKRKLLENKTILPSDYDDVIDELNELPFVEAEYNPTKSDVEKSIEENKQKESLLNSYSMDKFGKPFEIAFLNYYQDERKNLKDVYHKNIDDIKKFVGLNESMAEPNVSKKQVSDFIGDDVYDLLTASSNKSPMEVLSYFVVMVFEDSYREGREVMNNIHKQFGEQVYDYIINTTLKGINLSESSQTININELTNLVKNEPEVVKEWLGLEGYDDEEIEVAMSKDKSELASMLLDYFKNTDDVEKLVTLGDHLGYNLNESAMDNTEWLKKQAGDRVDVITDYHGSSEEELESYLNKKYLDDPNLRFSKIEKYGDKSGYYSYYWKPDRDDWFITKYEIKPS